MNTRVDTSNARRDVVGVVTSLVQLTKPGVTRLVFVTAWLGAVLAEGPLDLRLTGLALLGTVLVVASANTLNMVVEHEVDALMTRTRERPLPAGRLSREVALGFGLALGAAGLLTLGVGVNLLTTLLAAGSLATYVLVYTPMKAKSPIALYVGAVPGAMPPVLGYTGLSGELTPAAVALFAVLFAWQIPHFLAITLFRREEYRAAGLRVMSVVQGNDATRRAIQLWSLALIGVSSLPWFVGLGGTPYLVTALVSSIAFFAWSLVGARWAMAVGDAAALQSDTDRWARSVFFASLPYLVVLYGVLALSAP